MPVNKNKSASKKSARFLKATDDVVVVKGNTSSGQKTFRFRGLSLSQQMKKRNSAYQFFSIG